MKLTSDSFGRRLAAIRIDRGFTQAELGARVGKSKQTICSWEHGLHEIRSADAERCAAALGCRMRDFLATIDAPLPLPRRRRNAEPVG